MVSVRLAAARQQYWLLTLFLSLLLRSTYPSAQPTPSKKARKRKKKGTTTPVPAAAEDNASTEEALALQEWGLPAAFGTSKASCYSIASWIEQNSAA